MDFLGNVFSNGIQPGRIAGGLVHAFDPNRAFIPDRGERGS